MGVFSSGAKKQDLETGTSLSVEVKRHKIALFNVKGTYYALDDTCTHRGGPLSQGEVSSSSVICPWHGAQFDLRSGNVLSPPARRDVHSYRVLLEGDEIQVEIP